MKFINKYGALDNSETAQCVRNAQDVIRRETRAIIEQCNLTPEEIITLEHFLIGEIQAATATEILRKGINMRRQENNKRYFVNRTRFGDNTAYLLAWTINGKTVVYVVDRGSTTPKPTEIQLGACEHFVKHGSWREVTEAEAKAVAERP